MQARRLAGKPNFNQDRQQSSRAAYLAKERLLGICGDPFAFSGDLAMVAATDIWWQWSVSVVLGLTSESLYVFYTI